MAKGGSVISLCVKCALILEATSTSDKTMLISIILERNYQSYQSSRSVVEP